MKESVIVPPPPSVPLEVLITADLCDTINEKLIQIPLKKTVFSDVVINLAISPALNYPLTQPPPQKRLAAITQVMPGYGP